MRRVDLKLSAAVQAREWDAFPDADLTLDTSELAPRGAARAIATSMEAKDG